MARCSIVCLALAGFLVILARVSSGETWTAQPRWRSECQLEKVTALAPDRRVESEAGVSEYWDIHNHKSLRCAGVSVVRRIIKTRGLLLPSFSNAPILTYVLQGKGIEGAVIPGCPETFESGRQSGESRSEERHQKVREVRQGDILAGPTGVAKWVYNNGDQDLVSIAFIDVGNHANQLDLSHRRFHLAGNPQKSQRSLEESRLQVLRALIGREFTEQISEKRTPNGNLFRGFSTNVIADSFKVEPELARKLQNNNDQRERIVRVRGEELQLLSPSTTWEQEHQHEIRGGEESYYNGLEETFCSMRMRYNIDRPSKADIFNPRGGRVTTVNSLSLPILRALRLTAERGVLYKNGMMVPHINMNAHSVVYCTRGSARVQIVDDLGRNVFDGELRKGQLVVVPQNYAVVKQASNEGFEWISMKTNDRAVRAPLAGRVSAIRAMPVDVVANAFRISREQAMSLKHNRDEVAVFAPWSQASRE